MIPKKSEEEISTRPPAAPDQDWPNRLIIAFRKVRARTDYLCQPLATEDYVVQSMTECSPTKWHLAHTTWFFETFILQENPDYSVFDPKYNYLFNSYYNSIGERYARPERGMLTRPTVAQVFEYRRHVNEAMEQAFSEGLNEALLSRLELGINHEQQHQELLITDLKNLLSHNPLLPIYREGAKDYAVAAAPLEWIAIEGGVHEIGFDGGHFVFDNETPQHKVYVEPFWIASRLVTNGEYLKFMEAGGYTDPLLWLSDGFAMCEAERWNAPLYWRKTESGWSHFTLRGFESVEKAEPVTHISYYEAHAYAHWAAARLCTESEWEVATVEAKYTGAFAEDEAYHPRPAKPIGSGGGGLQQMLGDAWEWTESAYLPYPGYKAAKGALGEYNGKFMINQMILRGGSVATPRDHIRTTYRNFFPPSARWQFSGIRLAKNIT